MAPPIPKRPVGYRQGHCDAPIHVEVFVDIECPFSKKAWSTVIALSEIFNDRQMAITVYPVVLADHRQSWEVIKAAVLIAKEDPARFWDFFSYLYDRQETFSQDAFEQKTHLDLLCLVSELAAEFTGQHDKAYWVEQLQAEAIAQEAKAPIRFSIVRGVWSTPTFFVNGSEASSLTSSSSLKDWKEVLQPLLS